MSKDIPKDIMAQYARVISKLKRENITLEEWKSKILNTEDNIMEMNKWYIIDILGNGGYGKIDRWDLELLYPTNWSKLAYGTRVDGYFASISSLSWFPGDLYDDGLDLGLQHTMSYGVENGDYFLLEINYDRNFINWPNEYPLEVK